MTKRPALTDADYEALADSYEAMPPTAEEILGPVEVAPGRLRTGRPTRGNERGGKTPATTVRLPDDLRSELAERAKAGTPASETIRLALVEYFENHPKAG